MAIDYVRDIISSGYNLSKINKNFAKIQTSMQDGLSRSGTGPNQMNADLDMNGNSILNIGTLTVKDLRIAGKNVTGVLKAAEAAVLASEAAAAAADADRILAQQARDKAVAAANEAALATNDWVVNSFVGDGVKTIYKLSVNPGNKNNIHCYIDGVFQHSNAFDFIYEGGVTPQIKFTEPVPKGLPLEIRLGKAIRDVFFPTGSVIQTVSASYSSAAPITTAIPVDDTIPQITEGTELCSVSITPTSTTNKILIRYSGSGRLKELGYWAVAAFNGSANAVRASSLTTTTAFAANSFAGEYIYTPGSTSPITISLRAGPNIGGNTLTLCDSLGAVDATQLIVQEIKG